jgi:NADH-quinone oxidoreductase subunit L
VNKRPGTAMTGPLVVLAFLSVIGGYFKGPILGFLNSALPATIESHAGGLTEAASEAIAAALFLVGLYFAWLFHLQKRSLADTLVANPVCRAFQQWWFAGWGFDWFYDKAFIRPFLWFTKTNKNDFIDSFYTGVARLSEWFYRGLSATETGRVRWYTAAMAGGAAVFFVVVMFL